MKIGIAGFGAIGKVVAQAVDRELDGMNLIGICVRDAEKAKRSMNFLTQEVPVLGPEELAEASDVVVECVPKSAFMDFAIPALKKGRLFITVSGEKQVLLYVRGHEGRGIGLGAKMNAYSLQVTSAVN